MADMVTLLEFDDTNSVAQPEVKAISANICKCLFINPPVSAMRQHYLRILAFLAILTTYRFYA